MANAAKLRWRIAADIPSPVRETLLRRFQPSYARVLASTVTLAYAVTDDFVVPAAPQECSVTGFHAADGTEALVCRIAGQSHRPDGRRYFIGLSVDTGREVAAAGDIRDSRIELLAPHETISFMLTFLRRPMWKLATETNLSAA